MKLSLYGRFALAMFASLTLGLGMTGCGGGTIAFMWVLGQQYNQIAGFKVDDYTGNLTQIPHEPFATNGAVPVSIVVKPGGRYVYVLNQGTGAVAPVGGAGGTHAVSGNIAVFSVGGDGTLTFQQSYITQGFNSQYLAFDLTGQTLFVLDQYAPNYDGVNHVNGSITAFASDNSSGRLSLIQDTQTCSNTVCPTYTEVGGLVSNNAQVPSPFMLHANGSCVFAANANRIAGYAVSNGQLVLATNGVFLSSATKISSITGNGAFLIVTDSGADTVTLYAIGSGCSLQPSGAQVVSLAQYNLANPQYGLIDSSGKYLYILTGPNPGNVNTPFSNIMAFIITSAANNQLQAIPGAPYGVGANPICMVEDPTNQYMYTSNHNDGTVTGKVFDSTTGILSTLTRGSTFNAAGQPNCLAISGAID